MLAGLVMPGRTDRTLARASSGHCRGNLRIFRSRTDQAHLADQHVPQLGQFVQLGIAQPFPKGCDAVIIIGCKARPII